MEKREERKVKREKKYAIENRIENRDKEQVLENREQRRVNSEYI